jgi:predicted extracellular nuclease
MKRSFPRYAFLAAALWISIAAIGTAVSSTIVISEFRVRGPNGGSDEFVELYNLSPVAVNIGGWKIKGSNNAGTTSTRATITAGTTLNSGCHYLITNSSTSGGPYSGSVAGNQTYATGVTDDGGIAVTMADDTIVDQVGMSAGSAFKEGTILASLGSSNLNRGYERKPGGSGGSSTDTDNNSSDFQLVTPSDPQNTSSTCIGINSPTGVGASNPNSVSSGDSTLLTVTVTPGTNPASTGITVSANLTTIGGSASQQFYDDMTNGDVTPGDNVFSYQATVTAASGTYTLPFTVGDAQLRTSGGSIALAVAPEFAIHDIQGSGSASPHVGELLRTRGIVTGVKSNGFFIQSSSGFEDADPNTSEGLFVFTGSTPPVAAAVGSDVKATGTVQEFIPSADPSSPPLTELGGSPLVSVLSTGNPLPAATALTASDTDPSGSIEQLEKFEGMRVSVSSLTVVGPTQGSVTESSATSFSNGVFYGVITGVARPFREPGVQVPDPLPAGSPCCVPRFDLNPERLRVDSDAIGASALEVATGAVVTGLVGPLDYGFRTYTIDPEPGAAAVGGLSVTPVPARAADEFTVGSFNLERFFNDLDDSPGTNGEPQLTSTAFANRLNKASLAIRDVLRSPDILGVIEIENLATLQSLAAKLNADDPTLNYVGYLEEGNDIGGIDVGFLVRSNRVGVVDVTQEGKTATFIDPSDSSVDLLNDRPPLVLRANITPAAGAQFPVTVIVNHLRSLNDVDDLGATGDRVREKRRKQAEFLANLIQTRETAGERVISVGDYNAFQFNDGYVDSIGTIKGTPTPATDVVLASSDLVNPDLVDLVDDASEDQRYSYVFDGNAQVLDHILISANLAGRLRNFATARLDSDFPDSLRNDPNRPERISDHDAPVAYFRFPQLTALSPARIWVGLANSDDVGIKFDLRAEIYRNGIELVGSGELASAIGGSSGFNNAKLDTIPLTLTEPVSVDSDDTLSIKLLVRNACAGSGKNSGRARLWFNDAAANSRFDATVDTATSDWYLRDLSALAKTPGPGPKKTIDVQSGAKCSVYKPFGTWTATLN